MAKPIDPAAEEALAIKLLVEAKRQRRRSKRVEGLSDYPMPTPRRVVAEPKPITLADMINEAALDDAQDGSP